MLGEKLSHYYPDAQWACSSEGDLSTLQWFGPGDKPTEAEISALTWPVITRSEVNAERARRLVAGTSVTVTGHGPVALSGRDEDTRNLQGLAFAAQLRLSQGDTTHQTTFRDAENADHVLTPAQVLEMWSLGSAWIEQVYAASWALKDTQGGIPADYANDGYWPQ
ncbi:DUF4376 domain-containing protein [Rhodobacteraceae bacterium R_SAG2]|nr:DUF4376 domain-containing protein [Rhodobacteraceae bacterium R_SAG2]